MILKNLNLIFILYLVKYSLTASIKNGDGLSKEAQIWQQYGLKQLKKILSNDYGKNLKNIVKAKNIIFFLGDGMGMTTITAGRIFKGQQMGKNGEEESLQFDEFPHTGLAKTYNLNKQVPDSAGTATALFTGIKTDYGVIGMDETTTRFDSNQGKLTSFMHWAQKSGKRTGIVTTTRITHATPAATYANSYHRDWECDSEVPLESKDVYQDIARQLVENDPGRNFNVIFGGGLKPMGYWDKNETSTIQFEGKQERICSRDDDRNLVKEWLQLNGNRTFVRNHDELMNLTMNKENDHVLGLFRNNHITYAVARQQGEPSLSEMTQQAIRILMNNNNSKGFVLMVEGGRIDQGHHQNYAHAALQEVVEFDAAISVARKMTNDKDTLIIVTADHSHAMTLNGYPARGNDILGFANKPNDFPYETITYANGPGFYDHRFNDTSSTNMTASRFGTWIKVEELQQEKRLSPTYRHLAAMPMNDETHGGEDVPVYAIGPGSNLIRGVFEQNYLAYVMSYAGCMGPAQYIDDTCERWLKNSSVMMRSTSILIAIFSCLLLSIRHLMLFT